MKQTQEPLRHSCKEFKRKHGTINQQIKAEEIPTKFSNA